jgi:hypothetical protein
MTSLMDGPFMVSVMAVPVLAFGRFVASSLDGPLLPLKQQTTETAGKTNILVDMNTGFF